MFGHQLAVVLAQRHCHQSVSLGWHGLGSNMLLRTEESQGSKNQGRGKARSLMFDNKECRITVGARRGTRIPWIFRSNWQGHWVFRFTYLSAAQASFLESWAQDAWGLSACLIRPLKDYRSRSSQRAWILETTGIWTSVHCSHFQELGGGLAVGIWNESSLSHCWMHLELLVLFWALGSHWSQWPQRSPSIGTLLVTHSNVAGCIIPFRLFQSQKARIGVGWAIYETRIWVQWN